MKSRIKYKHTHLFACVYLLNYVNEKKKYAFFCVTYFSISLLCMKAMVEYN